MPLFVVDFCAGRRSGCFGSRRIRPIGLEFLSQRLARVNMVVLIMSLFMIVGMLVMIMMPCVVTMLMMFCIGIEMFGVTRVRVTVFRVFAVLVRLRSL